MPACSSLLYQIKSKVLLQNTEFAFFLSPKMQLFENYKNSKNFQICKSIPGKTMTRGSFS